MCDMQRMQILILIIDGCDIFKFSEFKAKSHEYILNIILFAS